MSDKCGISKDSRYYGFADRKIVDRKNFIGG